MDEPKRIAEYRLWEKVVYFFPVQLLFVHFKKNLILLLFWLLLFAIVTRSIGLKYGVPYLFLQPEYLGSIDGLSHFIMGVAMGGFVMAFNLSSYVVNGFRFSFLATLNRPFIKYCQNNILLPGGFALTYIISFVTFQYEYEGFDALHVLFNVLGFVGGNLSFILITATYFALTNKNSSAFVRQNEQGIQPVSGLFGRKQWRKSTNQREWKVASYISNWGKIGLARDSSHYDHATLEKVFAQNRVNAGLFQGIIIVLIFVLGWYSDTHWLMIPAAASILLFFTILIMVTSALYTWFRGWTSLAIVIILIGINALSDQEPFEYTCQSYGLNYNGPATRYDQANIRSYQEQDEWYKSDIKEGLKLLGNWKRNTQINKPAAIFINVPGGGLRSAMWTALALHHADTSCHGQLWNDAILISGSSGGMIGAAYLREYLYRDSALPFDSIISDLSSDKLNTVAATAVMNDLFFRFKRFEHNGIQYTKDRGHAFETRLNRDTRGWLNRQLIDYHSLEMLGEMPMIILAPTISEDGRKLLISSQRIAYLAHNTASNQINENIEFGRFFSEQGADELSFLSALRMSATFPYVFPATNLPTQPEVEVLDAGIRDNFGISNTLRFIYSFRNWLVENTSRVILIQVRDQEKFTDLQEDPHRSIWESITQPLGTFYNTVLDIQDYQMEDQLRMAYEWYDGDIEVIELVLERNEQNPISLSWHLTKKEKDRIMHSLETIYNQEQIERLRSLLAPRP